MNSEQTKRSSTICPEAERIHDLMATEAATRLERPALQAHLGTCPTCRAQVALHRELTDSRAAAAPTLSTDFQRNLRLRLREEGLGQTPAERERKTLQRWAAWLSLGAWGLLALVIAGVADSISRGASPWSPALVATLIATALLATGPIPWLWRLRRAGRG